MAYGDNPGKRTPAPKKKIKKKPYTLPKDHKTETTTDHRAPAKKGPPSPQATGKATRPQPIRRKRDAPPARTDRTSDAKRTPEQKVRDRKAVDTNVREARRKVIVKRQRGAVIKQAKKELEGRGGLAKGLAKAGDFIEGSARLSSTGGGPTAITRISQKATGSSVRAPRGAAAALAPKPVKIKGTVAGKIAKDLINLPATALPSVYVPAAGVVEAAKGRPQRIKKFAKDLKQSDPIYNTAAAGVEKLKGNEKAAKSHLRKAKKSVEEHPGYALVEAVGVKGAAGRGAGSVARSGVAGKKAKRAASTERKARQVPGTTVRQERTYSKDVITKATQVAVEKAKRTSAKRIRRQADEETPGSDRQVELREKAARRDPDRLPEKEINRRVDERIAVNEDLRRKHRSEVVSEARKVASGAKREGSATPVVAQRIARADKADLKKYVGELEREFDGLSNSGKRANKTLRRQLQEVIDDPKADMAKVENAAREYAELVGPLQRKLVKRGLLTTEQAERASLIPFAVRNMGAKHDKPALEGRAAKAKEDADKADAELRAAKSARTRLSGAQSVQRGKIAARRMQVASKEPTRARGVLRYIDEALGDEEFLKTGAALETTQAKAKAKANQRIENAKAIRKVTVKKSAEASRLAKNDPLLDKNGNPLSTEAMRTALGGKKPAFITQAPNQRGARNFNIRSEKAQAIRDGVRTGEATRKGTFDADPEVLTEGAARAQGLVDATDGFRKTIKEFAARGEDTKVRRFKSYGQAQQAARDLAHDSKGDPVPGGVALRPVRLNPFGAHKEQLDRLLEDVDSLDQSQAQALVDSMREGLTSTTGNGPWALIPETAAKRILDHLNAQGGGGGLKTLQLANQAFRKTVLSTSPSWIAGNVIEGVGRAALAKAGPKSFARGKKALKRLEQTDPKAYEEAVFRTIGGGHFSMADRAHIRRGAEQFRDTRLEPVANALGKFWRAPGPKQAAQVWHAYTDWMFRSVNGTIESKIQTAMLGRALKDAGLKAVDDAANGLKGTDAQVRFGREIDRMYGRYGKFSPAERTIIATYTPFMAWAVNAAYFVTRTLPRDHPVTTAVIAASVNATEDWRKEHGLDLFMDEALPGFLQGSVPTKGGGHFRLSRFTPFGAFGSPGETIASQVMPLWSSVEANLKGEDWKGRKLDTDELGRFGFAARSFAEATVPIYSVAKRVIEDGSGTLNPLKTVAPKKEKPKKKVRKKTEGIFPESSKGTDLWGGSSSSGSDSLWPD